MCTLRPQVAASPNEVVDRLRTEYELTGQMGFPPTVDDLQVERNLGGTTGAQLVRDPRTGRLYVRKMGASAEHIREECATDAAYRAMGVNVPEFWLYETPGGPVKLSRYLDNTRSLADILASGDQALIDRTLAELRQGFVADSLLANWDVIGLDADNILIDAAGKLWRIDNGGGLRFRAQGALKARGALDDWVTELWTLRNPAVNKTPAPAMFKSLGWYDAVGQMERILKQRAAVLDALPEELRGVMSRRLDTLADLAKMGRTFEADDWLAGYVDGFSKHSVGLRRDGLLAKLPKHLKQTGVEVRDDAGRLWDALRGNQSVISFVADYMRKVGADQSVAGRWMGEQAGSSWSGASQAVKYYLAQQRTVPMARYYWRTSEADAALYFRSAVRAVGEERFKESYQAWHAFNYEFLRNVEFSRNKIAKGLVEVMRTEEQGVMRLSGLAEGQYGVLTRGACESGSLFETVVVAGDQLTLQQVPHHRVMGLYMYERTPGSFMSAFMGDGENEVAFMPQGLESLYVGPTTKGRTHTGIWKKWKQKH